MSSKFSVKCLAILLAVSTGAVEFAGSSQTVYAQNIKTEEAQTVVYPQSEENQEEPQDTTRTEETEPETGSEAEETETETGTAAGNLKEPESQDKTEDPKELETGSKEENTEEAETVSAAGDPKEPEAVSREENTEETENGTAPVDSGKTEIGKKEKKQKEQEPEENNREVKDEEPVKMTEAEAAFGAMLAENPLYGVLTNASEIMVYQEASHTSGLVQKLPSGYQVTVSGVKDTPEGVWYQITFAVNDAEYSGFVPAQAVVSSDSRLFQWLETYFGTGEEGIGAEKATNLAAFPQSYRSALQKLMAAHPNWTFVPMNTGLEWADVMANEMVNGRNLVDINSTSAWKSKDPQDYNAATGQYYIKNGNSWVQASREVVSFYIDPRNFLTETSVFQFEQLTYQPSCHSEKGVERILKGTFMEGKKLEDGSGGGMTYAKVFMKVGKELNISPYFLASRVRQEQGVEGTSPLISGTVPGYVGYYNYFNNKATGTGYDVITSGLAEAMENGWNTRYAALYGGAAMVARTYISKGQDTLYLQKFDVDSSYNGLYWHQYMQNLLAADQEGKQVQRGYADMRVLNNSFVFKVPVYQNMPAAPEELPGPSFARPKLNAAKNGYTSVKLSWNAIMESEGYEIWRTSSGNSGYSLLADVSGINNIRYEDTSVVPGKKYTYKVCAYTNLWGRRKYSAFSNTKTADYTIPAAALTKVSSKNYTSAELSWKKVSGSGYKIYRKTDNGKYSCVKTVKGSSNISYRDSSLQPGHIYTYKIRTYRTVNGKNYYASYSGEKKISTKIAKAQLNAAAVSGGSSIRISWKRDSRANGYQIYRALKENGSYKKVKTISSNKTVSYKDSGISTGTTYYYKVRSYVKTSKGNKYSSFSNRMMVKTKLSKPAITSISSSASIRLKWKKSQNATGYKVYRSESYKGTYKCIKTLSKNTQTSYQDKNVQLGKVYYYKIRSYAKVGKKTTYSAYSAISCVQPELSETAILSVSGIRTNQASLKWEKITEADGYKIYRKTGTGGKYKCVKTISSRNTVSYKNTELKKGTKYYYKIRTYKKANGKIHYSAYSGEWLVQTLK